jgi:hypothetical protein
MTITARVLGYGSSATPGTAYTCNPTTDPEANRLCLFATYNRDATEANIALSTVAGAGLTFASLGQGGWSYNGYRATLWRAMGASPDNTDIVATFAAAVDVLGWILVEFNGVDTSGVNGAGAIVQVSSFATANSNTPAVALAAFADATNNATWFFSCQGSDYDSAPPTLTELVDYSPDLGADSFGIHDGWQIGEDRTPDTVIGAVRIWGAFGVEIKAAASAAADRGMPRGMSGGMSSFSGGMLGYRKARRGHIFVPELPRGMGWKRGLIRGLSGGMS